MNIASNVTGARSDGRRRDDHRRASAGKQDGDERGPPTTPGTCRRIGKLPASTTTACSVRPVWCMHRPHTVPTLTLTAAVVPPKLPSRNRC